MLEKYLADEPLMQCAYDGVGHSGPCPQPPSQTPDGVAWMTDLRRIGDIALDVNRRAWIWLPQGVQLANSMADEPLPRQADEMCQSQYTYSEQNLDLNALSALYANQHAFTAIQQQQSVPSTGFPQYSPPVMYDVTTDTHRAVTQADWDKLLSEFHRVHEIGSKISNVLRSFGAEVNWPIRS